MNTREGALKAAATNKARYGASFYADIGRRGGKNGTTGGFASTTVGKDGLTGYERARICGAKGGAKSRRGEAKFYEEVRNGTRDYETLTPQQKHYYRTKFKLREWND